MARALDCLLSTKEVIMRKIAAAIAVAFLAAAVPAATFAASKTSAAKPAVHTVSGTVDGYDSAGKTLTVKGGTATWTFDTAAARVWEGSKSVSLDELSTHPGSKVTVKYKEENGKKEAESVRLTPAHVKTASKSK
jgi:phage baseplate assembly protein gpV